MEEKGPPNRSEFENSLPEPTEPTVCQNGSHTASEPSVRFTSMNPACGVENIKLYYINNKKCHFSKWIGVI